MLGAITDRGRIGVTSNNHADERLLGARRQGAVALPGGGVRWRVWAPNARTVDLILIDGDRRRRLPTRGEGGYFIHAEKGVSEGQRYAYSLDGGPDRPDPASLWQPDGTSGP